MTRNAINLAAAVHAVAVLNGPTDEVHEAATCTALISTLTAPPTAAPHVHIDDVDRLLPALPCIEDAAVPPDAHCYWWGAPNHVAPAPRRRWDTRCWDASRRVASQLPRWVQHDAHSAHGLAALAADARTACS